MSRVEPDIAPVRGADLIFCALGCPVHAGSLHVHAHTNTYVQIKTRTRMHQNQMPDFQKTQAGVDLRMFTPAELQLDPDTTKGMTADEQREMIQKIYNEQVR